MGLILKCFSHEKDGNFVSGLIGCYFWKRLGVSHHRLCLIIPSLNSPIPSPFFLNISSSMVTSSLLWEMQHLAPQRNHHQVSERRRREREKCGESNEILIAFKLHA
jgi:hypothetical protein